MNEEIPSTPPVAASVPAPTPTAASGVPAPVAPVKKIGKFRGSYLLVTESLELLNQDKEIVLFPILTVLANLVVMALCAVVFFIIALQSSATFESFKNFMDANSTGANVVVYAVLFVFYMIGAFIMAYFQAGLVTIVHGRINGQNLTFADGLANANKHLGKIFIWSLVSATVGIILEFIENNAKWVGRIVAAILGTAWNIITLFIVPVLVLEDKSVKDSIARSGEIFKKTWGETLIMNFSTSLFFFGAFMLGIVAFIALCFTGKLPIILFGALVLFLYMLCIGVLSSTLSAIYKVVLYEYAAYGKIPDSFSPELLLGAIKKQGQ